MARLVRVSFCLLVFAAASSAQFGSGIQGTVADRTAAVIPGVTITAINVDTGVSRDMVSSELGAYRIASLSPGTYKVRATKEGFGSAEQNGVVVGVNEIRKVDFTLSVGNLVEIVNVTAQPTLLETEEG